MGDVVRRALAPPLQHLPNGRREGPLYGNGRLTVKVSASRVAAPPLRGDVWAVISSEFGSEM
jgi:hypothetical protein